MDPDTCLQDIMMFLADPAGGRPGYEDQERSETADALRNLADWIESGGFYPTVHNRLDSWRVFKPLYQKDPE
jgi:hypothetical protein